VPVVPVVQTDNNRVVVMLDEVAFNRNLKLTQPTRT
jgi:hypothetical protein